MPDIDGLDLAVAARKECPGTKLLLMPGSETWETLKGRQGCPLPVMVKPFDSENCWTKSESFSTD
jgi:hypothetical protein